MIDENLTEASLYSEEFTEIIGKAPPRIIFNSTIAIGCVLIILLVGGWFIRYPDILIGHVTIVSKDQPVKLVAHSNGRLKELFAKNNDDVIKGQYIAVIENSANTKDLFELKSILSKLDTSLDLKTSLKDITLPNNILVGDLQADYASFYQAVNNFKFIADNRYYGNQRELLLNQSKYGKEINQSIEKDEHNLKAQLKLEEWKDSINRMLLKEKVISMSEYNGIKKAYLSQNLNSSGNRVSLMQNKIQLFEYKKSIEELEQQYRSELNNSILEIKQIIQRLNNEIIDWENRYSFIAPISGKIELFGIWQQNQNILNGEKVFIIVPASDSFKIKATLPVLNAGKAEVGQRALIKLEEFPYEEYGMLRAEVVDISSVPLDSSYSINLSLTNGKETTLGKNIKIRPVNEGTVSIITKNKNILQRIFYSIYGKVN